MVGAMRSPRIRWALLLGATAFGHPTAAFAATEWNEATAGDLSNDGLVPTPLTMAVGSNRVRGTTGNAGAGVDRDYFKFTVPPGAALSALQLLDDTNVSGGVSFIGLQAGPQVTVTPSGAGAENLIAFGHYGNDQIGGDLLPVIRVGTPIALPAGTYAVWVQDTGGPASYGFDFVITSTGGGPRVPAASTWALGVLALLLLAAARPGRAQNTMAAMRPHDQ
jgi:hypothetical protein